jgi:primosomal protein N'
MTSVALILDDPIKCPYCESVQNIIHTTKQTCWNCGGEYITDVTARVKPTHDELDELMDNPTDKLDNLTIWKVG